MPWSEDKRETGSALMIVGWILVLFALLAMFFQPAALKLGETRLSNHRRVPGFRSRADSQHSRLA